MTFRGGRGRGRGRGGSKRLGTHTQAHKPSLQTEMQNDQAPVETPLLEITAKMTCREAILKAQVTGDYCLIIAKFGLVVFMDEILNLVEKKVDLSPAAKARILVALWINHHTPEFDKLVFDITGFFGTSELFKLVPLLDRPRRLRQLQKRITSLKDKAKERKLKALTREIIDLQREPHLGNLSSSFAKRVAKWVGTISDDILTFQAINYPTDNWKIVADLCHLKAADFQAVWFLPFCFGTPAPAGTLVDVMTSVTTETLASTIESFPYLAECYSMIRQRVQDRTLSLTQEAKACLAKRAPVEDVIWFYEDLVQYCEPAEEALYERLRKGEFVASGKGRVNYPKLMERIMLLEKRKSKCVKYLMEFASGMLSNITFPENNLRVAVFGDCSASMDVAVDTASIMASIFTARLNAKLTFFHDDLVIPPVQPSTTTEVLEVAKAIKAQRCTAPAACLWPYYHEKVPIDLFICVTDEEENTSCNGHRFAPLFKKYLEEVNPHAKIFFVSFLNVRTEGFMVVELKKLEIIAKQFRFDGSRPDLTKFDELMGLLTLQILDSVPKPVVEKFSYASVVAKNAALAAAPPAPASPTSSETPSIIALAADFVELDVVNGGEKEDEEWSDNGDWIEVTRK
ncbi:UNVERIFIED_CONTAM: hypothetical protein HDU68_000232 [Siphonaria sp. JEL0065]|nr:hypothetical protein HDU68_000232 [Siphonaria sp. JEL0065]